MNRQLSLDCFDTDVNLKTRYFLGKFCRSNERPVSVTSKRFYGCFLDKFYEFLIGIEEF